MLPENENLLNSLSDVEVAILIRGRAHIFLHALSDNKKDLAHRYLKSLKEMISFYESNY